jgi:hypothetical protein
MKSETYLKLLDELNITQEGAGILFGYSRRTGQRWAAEGPPDAVAATLLLVGRNPKKLLRVIKAARDA